MCVKRVNRILDNREKLVTITAGYISALAIIKLFTRIIIVLFGFYYGSSSNKHFHMSHYLILKIFSRKVKILIVIINLSPFGVYVLFFVCVSVCIVFFFGGGEGRGGFSSVWSELPLNKVTFLHFTQTVLTFLNLNVKAV